MTMTHKLARLILSGHHGDQVRSGILMGSEAGKSICQGAEQQSGGYYMQKAPTDFISVT